MSLRKAAKKMGVSHASVATQKRLMIEASRRGILDEYRSRIMAGEKAASEACQPRHAIVFDRFSPAFSAADGILANSHQGTGFWAAGRADR